MASGYKSTLLTAPGSSTYKYTLEAYFEEQSTSVSGNYSTIYCKATLSAKNISYSATNGGNLFIYWHDNKTNVDTWVASAYISSCGMSYGSKSVEGTINATHNDDGTLSGYAYAYFSKEKNVQWIPASGGVTTDWTALTTIARASSVSGGGGDIGSASTITVSRASSSFTHTLRYAFGNLSGTIATGVATSYTWTIPTSFYNQIPSSNSGTGTIYCDTYNGGTFIGTKSVSFTAKVINSNPTFAESNISYQDTNSSIVAITGNNQHIVRNQSSLSVAFTNATAKNGASMSSYQITFNGSTQTKSSASTINYGVVNISQNATVTIKAIDSRGNSTTATKTITILDWVLPSAIISLGRINNYEDTTNLKVQVTISSVNNKNAIQSIKYRYKKTTDGSYSAYTSINNDTQYTINFDKTYAWNIQIEIKDKFGTTTYNLVLAKGLPIFFIDIDKLSIGINSFPTTNNSLCLNGQDVLEYDVVDTW